MPEYVIRWNFGFGDSHNVVEADNEGQAMKIAYEQWREDAEDNADYGVLGEATEELREDYGL